jgi:hypothetical protein
LAVILATQVLAHIPTQKWVIFVSVSVEIFVYVTQACPKRQVVVRVVPHEWLKLVPVWSRCVLEKMGEDDAGMGNVEMWR